MKYFLKLLQLVMIFLLASCFKNNKIEDNVKVKKSNVESKINEKKENVYIHKQKENNEMRIVILMNLFLILCLKNGKEYMNLSKIVN